MRPSPLRFPIALLLTLAGIPAAPAGEFTLFKSVWGDAVVATDTTEAGKALTPPTPRQPVYYLGRSLGPKLGSIPGDDEPVVKELNGFAAKVLARQGYLGARPGVNDPSLFIVLQWGYIKPDTEDLMWFLGYNPDNDIAAPGTINMLGPEVFRRGMRSREIDSILTDSQNPIYGIIITAFDFKTARTPNPVVLWQSRIGLPANGKSMVQALPAMLIAAGPAIGRPADKPVFVDADTAREGTVKLGELKFLENLEEIPHRGAEEGAQK